MEKNKDYKMKDIVAADGWVPTDPEYYVKNSKMPGPGEELDLWTFLEHRPDKEWIAFAEETGANLTDECEAEPHYIGNVPIDQNKFIQFIKDNKDTCQKKYYEARPYHTGRNEFTLELPTKVGYNKGNCCEYNWGLYGDSNDKLKELLGKEYFESIKIDYDTALMRLLAYMPGQTLPWHFDYLGGWCRINKHLNPDPDTRKCDIGEMKRYLVMITDWHWGHMLQMANTFWPKWKSGDVWEIPMEVYHLSTNAGMSLKLSMSITGAKYA